MRKQIEFSKTIARRGGAAVGGDSSGGGGGGGARHLQVQGRFTSGGQVPELIVRKGENTREKIKGRRGREIRATAGAGEAMKAK